ncbi:MAG: PASTA domain-containing protein [Chitinophagaceae bacterium]
MFEKITHQPFWFNFLVAMGLIFLIGILFFTSLGIITKHGETIVVPGVEGKNVEQAKTFLTSLGFNVVVDDSAYVDSLPPLLVVRQMPEASSVVKVNRTIYLTVNKVSPPMTAMPDLVNYSFRSAEMTLQSLLLNVGDTIFRPDIAKNAVLEQMYQGKDITPGTLIPEGSKITLVLGNGLGNAENPVPNFLGLTLTQAKELLSASNLTLGSVLTDGLLTDTANAFIFQQVPAAKNALGGPNLVRAGESVDLWISQTMKTPPDSTGSN